MFVKRYLSESDRRKLCLVLLGLNIIQIFVSIAIFTLGAYLSLSVNSKARLVKGYSLKPIGATLSGCGIAMFSLHCFSAKVSSDCCYLRTRHRFENKLFLIVLGYAVMSLVLLAVSILCLVHNMRLKQALRHGLLSSMKFYARDKNKKRGFDEIQMEYRCCGNANYTDWFRIKWMPDKSVPSETDSTYRDHLHSVPFSCCDPSHAGPCFHRLVGTERGQYKYPDHGFFERGCTEVLLGVLREVTQATAVSVLVPIFLELTLAVQTRYLQTSLDDCKRRRNPSGIGNCWLFRRYPYEPDLQAKPESLDLIDPISLSSSDESVLYEQNGLKFDDGSDISTQRQQRLKREKQLESINSDDRALRSLLLRQTDANLRPKRRSLSGHGRKLKPIEGGKSKVKSKLNGELKTKPHQAGSNSETKALKDKAHEKARQISSGGGIPEVKREDARANDSESDVSKSLIERRGKQEHKM